MKKLIIAIMVMVMTMAAFADSYKLLAKSGNTTEFIKEATGLENPYRIKGQKTSKITTSGFNGTFVVVRDDGLVELISIYKGKVVACGVYVEGETK